MDGVTIHNILDKVDLLHFDEDSDSSPEKTSGNDDGSIKKKAKFSTNPTKAYLGNIVDIRFEKNKHYY